MRCQHKQDARWAAGGGPATCTAQIVKVCAGTSVGSDWSTCPHFNLITPPLTPGDSEREQTPTAPVSRLPASPVHTIHVDSSKRIMAWRSISTPVVAATLLGAVIALTLLSKPAPRRQTKAEKRVGSCLNVYIGDTSEPQRPVCSCGATEIQRKRRTKDVPHTRRCIARTRLWPHDGDRPQHATEVVAIVT